MSGDPSDEGFGALSEREAAYFAARLNDQIAYFDSKAGQNQSRYKVWRLIEILAAAAIPLLAGYATQDPRIPVLIGVLGAVVAVIAGIMGLYRFQENWTEYRATCETLKQEKYLYLARTAPYDGPARFELLVERVEAILRAETSVWTKAMRAAVQADQEARQAHKDGADA